MGADLYLLDAAGQVIWLVSVSLTEWPDNGRLRPLVELLHEALWFFLFGHMFVPFGKLECFGSGPLALLAASSSGAAGFPPVSMAWPTASARGGPLARP